MNHCILLGDSILDNVAYTGDGPAVIDHLVDTLDENWASSLLAVDGSTVADIPAQLAQVPANATHLVISAGGNDALLASGLTGQPANSVAEALIQLSMTAGGFEAAYERMLGGLVDLGKPAVLCTIYYPRFADPVYQMVAVAGLALFNDAIIRLATRAGLPLIDLRLVCDEPGDYANEIEPSVAGGAKIARAIADVVTTHDFSSRRTVVYS